MTNYFYYNEKLNKSLLWEGKHGRKGNSCFSYAGRAWGDSFCTALHNYGPEALGFVKIGKL